MPKLVSDPVCREIALTLSINLPIKAEPACFQPFVADDESGRLRIELRQLIETAQKLSPPLLIVLCTIRCNATVTNAVLIALVQVNIDILQVGAAFGKRRDSLRPLLKVFLALDGDVSVDAKDG